MKLRPYQNTAVANAINELSGNDSTLIVLPTGAGKTVVFSNIAKHFMAHGRVMIMAHREELIRQAAAKIKQIVGYQPAIEMANEWSNEDGFMKPRIVVSSVQTLSTGRVMRFNPQDFSLLITDEAHHATSDSYRKVYSHMLSRSCKHLGVTATPDRADEKALGVIFDSVAMNYELPDIIHDGWLVPIRQKLVTITGLDYSDVKTTAGDLNQADVAAAQADEEVLQSMCSPIIKMSGDKKTIVFATPGSKKGEGDDDGFHIAERMTEILNRYKPDSARRVSQDTPKPERRQMLQDFSMGRFQYLVNVGVLTEGFDEPTVEMVAITRPTKSRSLYSQMIGRGTRPLPGVVDRHEHADERRKSIDASAKPHVEVLDFVGNSGRHKLVTTADILGGNYEDEVIERAKKIAEENDESIDVSEILKKLDDESKEWKRKKFREMIIANAAYKVTYVDPFDVFDLQPVREREWDKGRPPTVNQIRALERLGIPTKDMTRSKAARVLDEAYRRRDEGLVSYRQIAAGADPQMTLANLNQDRFEAWAKKFKTVSSS